MERGVITSQNPGIFFGFCFLLELLFTQKNIQHCARWSQPQLLITSPQKVNYNLTCWNYYEGEEGGRSGKDADQGGFFNNSEGQINW